MDRWLTALRQKEGLTQKRVSELVGISQPSYCDIENGKIHPSVKTAKLIANTLHFDWTMFFTD